MKFRSRRFCGNCRFFDQNPNSAHQGECKRRAPSPRQMDQFQFGAYLAQIGKVVVGDIDDPDQPGEGYKFFNMHNEFQATHWPTVDVGEWCGEFEMGSAWLIQCQGCDSPTETGQCGWVGCPTYKAPEPVHDSSVDVFVDLDVPPIPVRITDANVIGMSNPEYDKWLASLQEGAANFAKKGNQP